MKDDSFYGLRFIRHLSFNFSASIDTHEKEIVWNPWEILYSCGDWHYPLASLHGLETDQIGQDCCQAFVYQLLNFSMLLVIFKIVRVQS